MAEELIIRVKIDGQEGAETGEGGRRGRPGNEALGAGAAAIIARNIGKSGGRERVKDYLLGDLEPYKEREAYSKERFENVKKFGLETKPAGLDRFGTRRLQNIISDTPYWNKNQLYTETAFGEHIDVNRKRYKALGAAVALKTAHSAVSVANHRSGDISKVESRNRTVKFAGYGAAIAMSGPAAGFVAAGLAVNEIVNTVSHRMNYKYDRALEGSKIRNVAASAGDLAYGRRRGGM